MGTEFSDLMGSVLDALDSIEGLSAGPVPFDATPMPNTLTRPGTKASYAIDIQTAAVGDRQKDLIRVEHSVVVSVLAAVKMGQWRTTLGETLDVEQQVIGVILTDSLFPAWSPKYVGTSRILTGNREYIRHDISFTFVATIPTGAT